MSNPASRPLPDALGPAARLFYAHWSPRLLTALALGSIELAWWAWQGTPS